MEALLRDLVAFRTVSGDHRAMRQLLDYVESYLTERGMHCRRLESNGFESLVAETRPGNKRPKVMLAAHADVVTAADEMFSLRTEGERYIGRGVLDMKFAIAVFMQIVDDLRDRLGSLDFCIVITGDEEIGGNDGMRVVIEDGYRPDICILPDSGENWQVQTSSKGFWAFDITSEGTIAHGSRPWLGDNALTKLLTALDEIAVYFPRTPNADTNTISLTRLTGGEAMNQIPGQGLMTIDIRTINQAEHDRIYNAVTATCGKHGLGLKVVSQSPPTTTDLNHPLIQPFVKLIEETTGVQVTGSRAMGASDARYLVPHNIPFISVFPLGGDLHGAGEWLDKRAFLKFQPLVRQFLQRRR